MYILPVGNYYKEILRIAWPAIAGLSTQILVSLVDAAMVGRLPDPEYTLAAMGIGVLATWAIVSFFSSLATGTHILIARRHGERDPQAMNDVLMHSITAGVIAGTILTLLIMLFSDDIGQFFAKDYIVGEYTSEFIFYRFLGLPFFLITVAFRGFYFGVGKTKIFMISAVIVNLLNILFNYLFIFGNFGFPEMGVAGAGLGSSLATLCDAIFYLIVSYGTDIRKKFHLTFHFKLDRETLRLLLSLSMPVSLQNMFILLGFLIFISITGLIGTIEQAATQAVISALFLSFMPCYGFGIAVQTLVGNHIGLGKNELARLYGFEAAKIATYYTLFLSAVFYFFPEWILYIITEDEAIIRTAIPALQIAGAAQIFYATGLVLANGLQAIGRSSYVMYAEAFSNLFIFVPSAYYLGIASGYGLEGAWIGLPLYIISYSIMIYYKFRFENWSLLRKF
ncbi:MAG: putative FMN/FAD exporter YeeO [Ignavibacteriaceae bacterium]|nr:putative FMN/FAD exporter YeeO [Ignavibacteriaceae bacterium]